VALENITAGSTIADLDVTSPGNGEDIGQGDDHIVNVKKAMQYTFMNLSATVSAVAAELDFAHKGGTVSGNAMIKGTLTVSGAGVFKGKVTLEAGLSSSATISGSIEEAAFARSASYAHSALHAVSASYAISALHAVSASYALSALNANWAQSASKAALAVSAQHAASASYALSALHANSANYAQSASKAALAVSAQHAASASYALSALHANSTSYALSALHANSASYALSALHANSANYATSAGYAASAGSTGEASAGNLPIGGYLDEVTNEGGTQNTSPLKVFEWAVPKDGTYRISFEIRNGTSGGGEVTYARVYRNGAAAGTTQSDSDGTYTAKSDDVSGWTAGDLLQIYLWTNDADNNNYWYIQNIYIKEATPTATASRTKP
jgi:hypothetical protein